MDYLAERPIATASRVDVVGNRLALIAPKDRVPALTIGPGFALAAALGAGGRLAVADPVNVPAGRYGKAALTAASARGTRWRRALAPADNVRAALASSSPGGEGAARHRLPVRYGVDRRAPRATSSAPSRPPERASAASGLPGAR